jgi:hypothetical protein
MSAPNLRERVQQTRLKAMRSRLKAASNICLSAENALVLGEVRLARDAVEQAKHSVRSIRVHLDEPRHVPADVIDEIRAALTRFEHRLSELEARTRP